jgi:hypothetical protein
MTPAERAEHGTRHLEHELAQIVRLRKRIEHGLADTPDDLVRAVRVAYAAHFRSLLEFFHNGRPSNAGPRDREDLRYTDFVCPDDANPSDQFGG